MGQADTREGLNPKLETWVAMRADYRGECGCPKHSTGPGGRDDTLRAGALGYIVAVDSTWVGAWWIGLEQGHYLEPLQGTAKRLPNPLRNNTTAGWYVCPSQIRLPTPEEEDEIVRALLSV